MHKPVDLLVIDSLSSFFPAAENHSRSLHKAMESLRSDFLAMGVLLVHHPRRAGGRPGNAARGSGTLPALTDVVLDLRLPGGDPLTRRRELFDFGRYPETPRALLMEMNSQATDYTLLGDADSDPTFFAPTLDTLRDLLARPPLP